MPKQTVPAVYSDDVPGLWLRRLTGASRAHGLDFIECRVGPAVADDKRYVLPVTIHFSHQQRWIIKRQRLAGHHILDLTPKHFDEETDNADPNWRLEVREFLDEPTVRLSFRTMKEALDYEDKLKQALSPLRDFIERCSPNRKQTRWKQS